MCPSEGEGRKSRKGVGGRGGMGETDETVGRRRNVALISAGICKQGLLPGLNE